jgi:hypothetical protein
LQSREALVASLYKIEKITGKSEVIFNCICWVISYSCVKGAVSIKPWQINKLLISLFSFRLNRPDIKVVIFPVLTHSSCPKDFMNKMILLIAVFMLFGCASAPTKDVSSVITNPAIEAQRDFMRPVKEVAYGGFNALEASQFLELCIELNNQDDREKSAAKQYRADEDKLQDWKIVYDSRNPGNTQWNHRLPWNGKPDDKNNPNNPDVNGFGPFNNAWLLAQSVSDPGRYAIAIRGTVGEVNSILADAFATTLPAFAGIEYPKNRLLPIAFAATPKAEVHLGFSYSAFTLLFEKEKGILAQLRKLKLPENAKLFVTGHSQGAAIGTILHAFMYYAITDPHDRYKLNLKFPFDQHKDTGSVIELKSYLFAQPKPGNQQFAEDFARISKDSAYVINNDLDPVAQVPLSLQTINDVLEGVEDDNAGEGGFFERLAIGNAQSLTEYKIKFRNRIAQKGQEHVAERFAKKKANLELDEYFNAAEKPIAAKASSLNYTLAGQLIPVFGFRKGGDLYPNVSGKPDMLLQHHATSYRILMDRQFKDSQ